MVQLRKTSYIDQLKVDQALLNVTSVSYNKSLWLYQLSDECVQCPYKRVRKIPPHGFIEEKVPTTSNLKWAIYDNNLGPYAYSNSTPYCNVDAMNLGQFGVYNLTIDDGCTLKTHKPPINENLTIVWMEVATIIVFILWRIFRKVYQARSTTASTNHLEESQIEPESESHECPQPSPTPSTRLNSLDTFRGLAIVSMIFANSGCGKYHWLEHVPWNGIHPADFIFPSFLWIMGVCVPISIQSQIRRSVPTKRILLNILIRSIKLFLVGVFIHTAHGPNFSDIRIMGVLQRFGIAYFVVASIYALLCKKSEEAPENEQRSGLSDIKSLLPQWLIMLLITAVHLLLIFLLPVPNCGAGYLGPGGIHEMSKHNGCIGGASGYIDRMLLSQNHLYQGSRAARIYDEAVPFDPEGPFGSLLSIVHAFFGLQCGEILLQYKDPRQRVKRWLSWSFVTFLMGGSLCRFSINDGLIPINKNLWSLSFVLITTAFAYLLLTILYIAIDVKKSWTGRPLGYAGMNAILMYIGSELLGRMYPFYWHFEGMNTHLAYFVANVWNAALWNWIAYYLFKRNVFFTL